MPLIRLSQEITDVHAPLYARSDSRGKETSRGMMTKFMMLELSADATDFGNFFISKVTQIRAKMDPAPQTTPLIVTGQPPSWPLDAFTPQSEDD